jgi:ribosome-binding protein aMBF1 (putative translation factor)
MNHQDWTPVVIHGKAAATSTTQQQQPKSSVSATASHLAKLDRSTEPSTMRVKVLTMDSVRTIQAFRAQHELTQKMLNEQLSFPPNTINALEARRVGPTGEQLRRLNSHLKTGLTLE